VRNTAKKKRAEQERFAKELQEKFGISIEVTLAAFNANPDSEEDIIIEAESTLIYFNLKGKGFIKQVCPECGETFAYKYRTALGPMKCSNACRKAALAKIGIQWDPYKSPEERWGLHEQTKGVLPAIVSPQALKIVDKKLAEQ
jgi:hypothetical protein